MFEDMLFRYRSGDQLSVQAFEEDKLFFSTPEYFNDPFDSIAYIDYDKLWNSISYELNNHMQESIEIQKKELFPIVTEYNQDYYRKQAKDEKRRTEFFSTVENTVKYVSKKITENCKIICFSEEYLSNLMWSHYANYHKGFVLAFLKKDLKTAPVYDNENKLLNTKRKLRQVSYDTSMPDFGEYMYNILPYNDDEILQQCSSMLINMLSSKTIEWSYEKEWRLCSLPNSLEKEDSACYINITPSCIFVGARMNPSDRWKIYNIAKKKGIPVFEVWCNSNQPVYKLNFCELNGKELRRVVKT